MRLTPILMTGAALTGAFLSGPAMAQPASTGGTEVETAPSNRTTYTVGLGAGLAPDYEGSDHYEIVPLWNLRVNNLYNPNTFVQILGPRLRSNFLPSPHWQLGLDGQFIKERDHHVHDSAVSDLKSVDPSLMLGVIGGYDFLADPREQLAVQVEARQDVANGNGALATRVCSAMPRTARSSRIRATRTSCSAARWSTIAFELSAGRPEPEELPR
jgi:outer membrane protein